MLTITTTSYCFCLFPKCFFHRVSTSLSSQNFTNLIQVKNDEEQLHPLSSSSFGWCPLPWLPPLFVSQLQHLPTLTWASVISHFPISLILLLSPPLPFLSVSHSQVVFSSHNKVMFSSSCLKPILDLICPSSCSFLSLSSGNSLKVLFLVPGVPLLIPIRSLPQTLPCNCFPLTTLRLLRH